MAVFYALLKTGEGWIGVGYTLRGLLTLTFPRKEASRVMTELKGLFGPHPLLLQDEDLIDRLEADLNTYFSGRPVAFDYPLDLERTTPFQQKVLKIVRTIPHGEVRTYGEIAKALGKPGAARAVGGALRRNPLPILIPCHRVIAGDGSLGGFSSGLYWKRRLLTLEGIKGLR